MDITEVIQRPEYSFITEHENLGQNIIFLTFGGSHAYGTNIETSDIDIRGCALPRKHELIGFSNFQQFEHIETDTTIYCFTKLVKLMVNCNPNTIEMFGCKPEHYTMVSKVGQELLNNKKMFLSRQAANAFSKYATTQLRKLQNAVARDSLTQHEKEVHILNSVKSSMASFNERYENFDTSSIKTFIATSKKVDLDTEIFVNINLKNYPLRDLKGIMSEMSDIVKLYGKINHRKNKKDELHLNKQAMHIIRIYLMALDIFKKEEIITYREHDLPLLKSIRNGEFMNLDGTYQSGFFDMVNEFDKRLKYASSNSSLPVEPNMDQIQDFVVSVHEQVVRKG